MARIAAAGRERQARHHVRMPRQGRTRRRPEAVSHSLTSPSSPPVASVAPSGANERAANRPLVPFEARSKRAGAQVPDQDKLIRPAGGEQASVHRRARRPRPEPRPSARPIVAVSRPVTGVPDPYGLVVPARGERCAVGREGHGEDPVGVPRERGLEPARGHVPELHGPVVAARGQRSAVGREGQARDGVAVPFEPADHPARGQIPQPDHRVVPGRSQGRAVRGIGDGEHHRPAVRGRPRRSFGAACALWCQTAPGR